MAGDFGGVEGDAKGPYIREAPGVSFHPALRGAIRPEGGGPNMPNTAAGLLAYTFTGAPNSGCPSFGPCLQQMLRHLGKWSRRKLRRAIHAGPALSTPGGVRDSMMGG